MAYWVSSDVYNQRLHSHYLCKNPPGQLRKCITYLIINLTLADLLIAAVCLAGKRIYYKIIIFSWLGALTLACGIQISRMIDVPLADRYPWIIYICLTLAVLTTSYVIIMSKFIRRPHVQQLGSVMSAERKLSVTLFIVSAASILTLLPWVIIMCIVISSDRYLWIKLTPMKIASTFYLLNSILNPVIYVIRLPEFRRALKKLFCKNTLYPVRRDQPIELQAM